jgi:hypothetical protein
LKVIYWTFFLINVWCSVWFQWQGHTEKIKFECKHKKISSTHLIFLCDKPHKFSVTEICVVFNRKFVLICVVIFFRKVNVVEKTRNKCVHTKFVWYHGKHTKFVWPKPHKYFLCDFFLWFWKKPHKYLQIAKIQYGSNTKFCVVWGHTRFVHKCTLEF